MLSHAACYGRKMDLTSLWGHNQNLIMMSDFSLRYLKFDSGLKWKHWFHVCWEIKTVKQPIISQFMWNKEIWPLVMNIMGWDPISLFHIDTQDGFYKCHKGWMWFLSFQSFYSRTSLARRPQLWPRAAWWPGPWGSPPTSPESSESWRDRNWRKLKVLRLKKDNINSFVEK